MINDLHLGVQRSGGTTLASAQALKQHLQQGFVSLLQRIDSDLLINGDLFDTFNVPLTDLLATYISLSAWLDSNSHTLYLAQGNHDAHSNSALTSGFLFLGKLLKEAYGDRVVVITEPTAINERWYVVPHLLNQDLFDAALAAVPECEVLFLHANYDNNFAVNSDHSLNVTEAQAKACKAQRLVFAHEHHDRLACGGKVIICGNQLASSVADCITRQSKQFFTFHAEEGRTRLTTVNIGPPSFVEMAWNALVESDAHFIRVTGRVDAEDAAAAVSAISRYRSTSPAFVVSNATNVQVEDNSEVFAEALEEATSFDVLAALKELLSADEWKTVEVAYAQRNK